MNASRRLFIVTVILLVGALIRIHGLGQDRRFHPDEAWFSTFARGAALNGDWMLHGPLDKPPLSIYASALSMTLFVTRADERGLLNFDIRQGEFAARLPSTFFGILLIAAVCAFAARLYRQRTVALWSAAFVALSPFAVAFSATAFTDMTMLLFLTLALERAAAGRWSWSGVCLALAFAAKQQALFYLPLILALGWLLHGLSAGAVFRFLFPFLLSLSALFFWDSARRQLTSLWLLAYINNDPARLIRANEVVPRLMRWLDYGRHLLGAPTPLFAAVIPVAAIARIVRAPRQRATAVDVVLLVYMLAYLLLHWLVAFNTYDRYLLPLLPPFALLAARGGVWLWNVLARFILTGELGLAAAAITLTLLLSAVEASERRLPFVDHNGSFPDYEGMDDLADFLNAQPPGAIVYDHWLTWELGYYMGQWTDKRRVYYPSPDALVADALQQSDPAPRYFPIPVGSAVDPWLEALREADFEVSLVYQTARWTVYRLIPPWSEAEAAAPSSPHSAAR